MRRGYWTGLFTGGLIGMLAFRAYGDEITTWVHKRLEVANEGMDGDALKEEAVPAYPARRPFRRRRLW